MARRRTRKKPDEVIDAEFVAKAFDPADELRSPEEIAADEEDFQLRLRARWDTIKRMGPDERFDAITAMTDMIQLKLAERVMEREVWLDHAQAEVREEAQNFIVAVQDQINKITQVRVQLYNALGLGEKPGALPGGATVPKLLIPSRTADEFEREFGEAVQQFGPPKGDA